jgi:CDP-paratose 2-epimerase
MRILITGGAGFVGSNVALSLKNQLPGAEIVVMDNLYRRGANLNVARLEAAGVRFVWGDVRTPEGFPEGPFDLLIECSAEPSVLAGHTSSPDYLFQTNLVGAYHCLEKARSWGARVIFLSTSRVYPVEMLEKHPWREEETRFAWEDHDSDGISSRGVSELVDMNAPRSLYGYTKLSVEQLIMEYRSTYGMEATVNRCGVIAGPWQFGKVDQGVAALWVMAHHYGRPLTYIGYGGQGKQVRDLLHIDDLCDLIQEQVAHPAIWNGWVGNVSGGLENTASLQELTALCQKHTGKTVRITAIMKNRPSDLRLFIGDCARLFQITSWRPRRDVETIIADTAAWVSTHETDLAKL